MCSWLDQGNNIHSLMSCSQHIIATGKTIVQWYIEPDNSNQTWLWFGRNMSWNVGNFHTMPTIVLLKILKVIKINELTYKVITNTCNRVVITCAWIASQSSYYTPRVARLCVYTTVTISTICFSPCNKYYLFHDTIQLQRCHYASTCHVARPWRIMPA